MVAQIKIRKQGLQSGAKDFNYMIRQLVRTVTRQYLTSLTKFTINSGGTNLTTISKISDFVNVANASTNLADKTTTEAAYTTVLNALRELYGQANTVATTLGLSNKTYNGGGATPDLTIAAVTVSVTAAATGVQATEMNTLKDALDNGFYQVANMINGISAATGETKLIISYNKPTATTIAAITVDGGTAASPGITKVAIDASLVTYRANVFALASKLNAAMTAAAPRVIAV